MFVSDLRHSVVALYCTNFKLYMYLMPEFKYIMLSYGIENCRLKFLNICLRVSCQVQKVTNINDFQLRNNKFLIVNKILVKF